MPPKRSASRTFLDEIPLDIQRLNLLYLPIEDLIKNDLYIRKFKDDEKFHREYTGYRLGTNKAKRLNITLPSNMIDEDDYATDKGLKKLKDEFIKDGVIIKGDIAAFNSGTEDYYSYAIYDGENFINIPHDDALNELPMMFDIFSLYSPDYFNVFDEENKLVMYLNLDGVEFDKNYDDNSLCFKINDLDYCIYNEGEVNDLDELEDLYKKLKLVPMFANLNPSYDRIKVFYDSHDFKPMQRHERKIPKKTSSKTSTKISAKTSSRTTTKKPVKKSPVKTTVKKSTSSKSPVKKSSNDKSPGKKSSNDKSPVKKLGGSKSPPKKSTSGKSPARKTLPKKTTTKQSSKKSPVKKTTRK